MTIFGNSKKAFSYYKIANSKRKKEFSYNISPNISLFVKIIETHKVVEGIPDLSFQDKVTVNPIFIVGIRDQVHLCQASYFKLILVCLRRR